MADPDLHRRRLVHAHRHRPADSCPHLDEPVTVSRPISWEGLSDLTFTHFAKILSDPGMGEVMLNTAIVVLVTATATTAMSVWIAVAAHRRKLPWQRSAVRIDLPRVRNPQRRAGCGGAVPVPVHPIPDLRHGLDHHRGTGDTIPAPRITARANSASPTGRGPDRSRPRHRGVTLHGNRKILLPLLRQALWKCWLWVFAHALGELPIALLLTSADNRTLVVEVWDTFTSSVNYPQASALAVIILVISMIAVLLVNRRGASEKEA
jgi:iron(III) transport system permease protein